MRSRCKADRALVLHLLGCAGESLGPEPDKRLDAAIERCEAAARPKGAWRLFETCESPGSTEVVGTSLVLSGAAPREALSGCRHVALMACTLRDAFEREHGVAAQPSVLEASRALGVRCTAYGSMVPSKSLTAIVGLFDGEHADKSGCENCSLSKYCELKKRGVSCIQ